MYCPDMARNPRLADVALACGVSLATVSKALSPHLDRCDLRPDTRARIVAKAHELGWSRDRPRSARARRSWHNIGVLWGYRNFAMASYEHVPEALAAAVDGAYRLLLTPVPQAKDWKELQLSLRLDGVIVLGHVEDAILAELEHDDYPAVLVNLETPRRLHQVLADDLGGATALIEHLAGLGHRRIVFMRNPWPVAHCSERDRLHAIRRTASNAGMTVHEVRGLHYDRVLRHCRAGATAVVCNSHWGVADLLAVMRGAGLAVPHDISLVSCHDLSSFAHFDPPVTGVVVPTREMAEIGAGLLQQLITGREVGAGLRRIVPETLVLRGSSARARENRFTKASRRI
jgi:DNA-binding LacI/PurR family transcriptional regulator